MEEKSYIVAILGSSVDLFFQSDSYPVEGEYSHAKEGMKSAGGPSLNMGCVASSHGADVRAIDYLPKDDEITKIILEALEKNHVNTEMIQFGKSTCGKVIVIDTGHQRTMFVCDPVRPTYVVDEKMQEFLNHAGYMYSMMHIVERSFGDITPLKIARKHGAKMIFDGCSKYEDPKKAQMLLDLADGLFINSTDYKSLEKALQNDPKDVLLKNGCEFICVTDGGNGSTLFTQEETYFEKAMPIKPIETTGAGDSFAGTFLFALQKGYSYKEALHFATAGGAYNCMHEGGLGGVCSFEELKNFMKEYSF